MRSGHTRQSGESTLAVLSRFRRGRADTVIRLDGPSPAQSVIEELRDAIHEGDLLPGQALSLRSLAEARGLRFPALMLMVERLQREQLLDIRGDVAIVAPLDADELTRAFWLGDSIAPAMALRAMETVSPAQLRGFDELYLKCETSSGDRGTVDQEFRALARMPAQMVGIGSPASHRQAMYSILDFTWRHIRLVHRSLPDQSESPWVGFLTGFRDVIDLARRGKAADAVDVMRALHGEHQDFIRLSFELYRGTDDDFPIAQVIPLDRAASRTRGAVEVRPKRA